MTVVVNVVSASFDNFYHTVSINQSINQSINMYYLYRKNATDTGLDQSPVEGCNVPDMSP